MICPFGTMYRSPFRLRRIVVRRPTSSTTPDSSVGSSVTKSPTPYWFSTSTKMPAITSWRKRCAPKPTRATTSVAPAAAVSSPRRKKPISTKAATAITK